jgi:hypothetical protein
MANITGVTITGADDSTSIPMMVDLSKHFPFLEWGILISRRQEGSHRFPGREWMGELVHEAFLHGIKLSTHICGSWVRQLFVGEMEWHVLPPIALRSQRVQINTHAQRLLSTCKFIHVLSERSDRQYIFQWDGVNDHLIYAAKAVGLNAAALYDLSGGAGILPESWPQPAQDIHCGYAGGLGPDNVTKQIEAIEAVCDQPYWIDMERRVRTPDDSRLDMDAVLRVLEAAAKFITQEKTK